MWIGTSAWTGSSLGAASALATGQAWWRDPRWLADLLDLVASALLVVLVAVCLCLLALWLVSATLASLVVLTAVLVAPLALGLRYLPHVSRFFERVGTVLRGRPTPAGTPEFVVTLGLVVLPYAAVFAAAFVLAAWTLPGLALRAGLPRTPGAVPLHYPLLSAVPALGVFLTWHAVSDAWRARVPAARTAGEWVAFLLVLHTELLVGGTALVLAVVAVVFPA